MEARFGPPAELSINPHARHDLPYGPEQAAVLDAAGVARAMAEISAWPGYAPTPLRRLDDLAARSGFSGLFYKDEGSRFGLGSFKALGGAYAVARVLAGEIARHTGRMPELGELRTGEHHALTRALTVCCATDGNHGRSVAWGARLFGCRCRIYVHATVSAGRVAAIEAFGADVERVAGTYDEAVRKAAVDAAARGWVVVSDTSWPGYMEIPKDVMAGYGVMAAEAIDRIEALGPAARPSHVFVQGGVGGLAAAILACFWQRYGADRPRLVVVEPVRAACLLASARTGEPAVVEGDLETVMAGLSCGEISHLAWPILSPGAFAFMAIEDEAAIAVMRLLADRGIVAGESATAGLAGALAARGHAESATALGLDRSSRVLVFGTEGATDPALYERLVGRSAEAVAPGWQGETP